MRNSPPLQFCIDVLAGLLIGVLLGAMLGLAVGVVCGFVFFCLPFMPVVGILILVYSLGIGLCSGSVTGLVCGAITGGRVTGVNLKSLLFLGIATGAPPGIIAMQWFHQHSWNSAKPTLFVLFGAVAGAFCGQAVALTIGRLNRRHTVTPPYDVLV